jgi:hypothetical protein
MTPVEKSRNILSKRNTFTRTAVLVGIAILVNVFLVYVVRVFYHEPSFTDFCPEERVVKQASNQESCLASGGQWNENGLTGAFSGYSEKAAVSDFCDEQFTCSRSFTDATSLYNRNSFVIFVIVGAALLLCSPFVRDAKTVSSALSLGGVIALIFGSMRYWSDMDDRLRVVTSGVALLALLIISWKRFKDE